MANAAPDVKRPGQVREGSLAKPEWGFKRTCQACGARFYDMGRSPVVCPSCNTVFDPLGPARSRRNRAAAEPVAAAAAVEEEVAAPVEEEVAEEAEDETAAEDSEAEESESEDIIEDASELGEDEDDMAEVMDHYEDGDQEES